MENMLSLIQPRKKSKTQITSQQEFKAQKKQMKKLMDLMFKEWQNSKR